MFRYLTSPDPIITSCDWGQLKETVSHRTGECNLTTEHIESFLNSSVGTSEQKLRDIKSIWSDARLSLHQVGLRADLTADLPQLTTADSNITPLVKRRSLVIGLSAEIQY